VALIFSSMIVTIRSMTQLALTAIGRDRPGIVAEVTRALLGHSLNITDSHMGVLGGRFSMMLIVEAPEATDLDAVREELARTRSRLDLDAVALHPLAETGPAAAGGDPSHIVTVYGVDHPGIVHAVSARLASKAVNVTDLETRLVGDGLYAMVLEIALPPDVDPEALAAMLAEVGAEQGVEVTVRPLESDVM
jgi:glycine cleavage system transcriptional repressor